MTTSVAQVAISRALRVCDPPGGFSLLVSYQQIPERVTDLLAIERHHRTDRTDRPVARTVGFVLFLVLIALIPQANAQQPLSVPAEFVRFVTLPGTFDQIVRPTALHVDRYQGEVLVADGGHARILIFDSQGCYRFEFSLQPQASMALDLAVDSRGFIYVVASTTDGHQLLRYDFDGTFLERVPMPSFHDGRALVPDRIATDEANRLVVVDERQLRVAICTPDGRLEGSFDLAPDLATEVRAELVLGSVALVDDKLYVPISSQGRVEVVDLGGTRVQTIGHQGNRPGQLGFPVAVSVGDNLVAVLDKHRFNVVCFDAAGRFLGEFGGRGISPGWFYYPTLLGLGTDHLVFVGQIFENKVQVCRIPGFITTHRRQDAANDVSTQGS